MNVKLFAFLLVLNLLNTVCSVKKKPKSVTTLIDAKWEVTPLVLEIAEYLYDENPNYFWSFIDSISELSPPLSSEETPKAAYERALEVAGNFLSVEHISLLKFALSLHIYSPRVEMFCQIAQEKNIPTETAAEVDGNILLSTEELIRFIQTESDIGGEDQILRLDHKYPGSSDALSVVFLYGEIGTPSFAEFHSVLKKLAQEGKIQYVLRHWVKERQPQKLRLSGYGVELQMKSTEYKAQDDTKVEGTGQDDSAEEEEEEIEGFNFGKLKNLYPGKAAELNKLKQELVESTSELAPLKVWQFQELSLQAAQRIMSSPKEEALNVMMHIAQNFPSQARSLVKTHVSSDLKSEMKQNQDRFASTLHLQPSDSALFINGMFFDLETQDIFTILDYVRQELRAMEGLHEIGITEKKVSKALLWLDLSNSGSDYALEIRDSSIMWLNDIENDKMYKRWSSSLMDLLRPTFPGMLRSIRKNLYNLVLIGDPSTAQMKPLIKLLQSFLMQSAPVRMGLVFAVNSTLSGLESPGVAMLNAFNYVSELKDVSSALEFLTDVYSAAGDAEITPVLVKTQLEKKFSGVKSEEVFELDSDYNTGLKLAAEFISRSGFRTMPQALLNGVPLSEKSLSAEEFEEAVLSEIVNQTPTFQKAVYRGELSDRDDLMDYLMERPNVMPRLNERVLSPTKSRFIDLRSSSSDIVSSIVSNHIFYASNKYSGTKDLHHLSNWIITDLGSKEGRSLFISALQHMGSTGKMRTGLVVNEPENKSSLINKIALAIMKNFSPDLAFKKLKALLKTHDEITRKEKGIDDFDITEEQLSEIDETLAVQKQFLKEILNFEPGTRGILSNGKLLGPLDADEVFNNDDFSLLERYSFSVHLDKIIKAIRNNIEDVDLLNSDMLMKSVSLLAARPESRSRFEINPFGEEYSVLKLQGDSSRPVFDLIAIVNPVSHGAHKLGSALSVLQQVINCDIKLFLNCVEKNSDMPLKSFYRYVIEPTIQFTSDGELGPGPMARFSNMPGAPLLTQNMLVPDNWMVESIASPHDLDNIRLDQVDSNVHSKFELEYLILEGHCFDTTLGSPPRGLQINLGTDASPNAFDTIVMSNLGYFQLKANPGAWKLKLRSGRSSSLFDITGYSHEGIDYPVNSSEIKILLSSFRAHTIKLKVTKKPDKMGIDLLGDDNDENQGLWGSITSKFTGSNEASADPADERINIFSVASGHLYERFIRIMMLSVLKNTKSPVKFWFLKNYLSPTLKDFLPRMAKHYGFEYELVQYKWPRWLHQQTEKQRIIWGYKILFLDVLFPLDVKKIIFVDADQVVRADMKELVDFDLGGAPYGYTPFCDSRTEMDGFRFWRSGYWRNHLQGRKYHISALYVVDLKKFRRVAAGDRLRGQYQALSQDPNSLSNLDQDLPNNMIHQVAIKSLPQDWLWCETWCDDVSKATAKTIDLCNNPLTKEAKLTAAMRIVKEWKDYDNEIKNLQLRLGETEDHEEEAVEHSKETKQAHTEL